MAERNFSINEAIEVQYQAGNGESGLTIQMKIVKPDKTFVSDTPIILTEIGNSGRYYGSFVPDSIGEWSVQVQRSDGSGKLTKAFSVGATNVQGLGDTLSIVVGQLNDQNVNLGVVQTKVDNIKGNVDKISGIESDITFIKQTMSSPAMFA